MGFKRSGISSAILQKGLGKANYQYPNGPLPKVTEVYASAPHSIQTFLVE